MVINDVIKMCNGGYVIKKNEYENFRYYKKTIKSSY